MDMTSGITRQCVLDTPLAKLFAGSSIGIPLRSLDSGDGFKAAAESNDPKHIGLPHKKRSYPKDNRQNVAAKRRRGLTKPAKAVPERQQHGRGRHDVGVVETGKEEQYWKERNIDTRMKCVSWQGLDLGGCAIPRQM